jgi:hypothetical protein
VRDLDAQRDLLLAAIVDVGRSVSTNDQKASAALIVHGLLFAGVTAVIDKLGSIYGKASGVERVLGCVLLIAALLLFVLSVVALLLAVLPYRPKALYADLRHSSRQVFFPIFSDLVDAPDSHIGSRAWYLDRLSGSVLPDFGHEPAAVGRAPGTRSPLLSALQLRLEPMSKGEVNRELMAEVLKLRDILDWESQWARLGYVLLAFELLAISGFFVLLIAVSTSQVHA